ncbi:uncharacterized protein LOC143371316 isoform X2 [Andrena cerasifolii]|uniref:uncharacterized protein LOC143371316 isoform X2 n=1 Tax=Andrena cerasifolii TaxID=2819439 RepID=UPI004037CB6D
MSGRSQRGIHETSTTKRYLSPHAGVKKRCVKQQITYDYDAAVSQPDVPHFLELKKNGRCPMVSGAPLRKRTLRTRIRSRVMSKKNFQKRSQALGLKSRCKRNAKSRPPDGNGACRAYDGVASSGVSDEERDVGEKENVTSNGTVDVDTASNFFKVHLSLENPPSLFCAEGGAVTAHLEYLGCCLIKL